MQVPWQTLEEIIRQDPGQRGVAGFRFGGERLCTGHLERAAIDLAERGKSVAIVTGFCAFDGQRWTAETDGPPGALYLARALTQLGVQVTLLADAYALAPLQAGCQAWELPLGLIKTMPFESAALASSDWMDKLANDAPGKPWTHLIAIERCGPNHTLTSLCDQRRQGPAPVAEFEAQLPAPLRDRCYNMRGIDVTVHTAPAHRLFEAADKTMVTIGLADGGNEIGMGGVPWEILRQAICQGPAGLVACRVATDFTLLAGVSNWSAYALASAICVLRGRRRLLAPWTCDNLAKLIVTLVEEGGAVDGVTKLHTPTVDGLPLEIYLQTVRQIREVLGVQP